MEKQKQLRCIKRLQVRYGPDIPSHLGFTIDVSESGLFVKATIVYPPGTRLVLDLALPDGATISLRGEVSWVKRVPPSLARHLRKAGMGIAVLEPPVAYLDFVRSLTVGSFPASALP